MSINVVADVVREVTKLAELDPEAVRLVGAHLRLALQLALDRQSLLTRTPISPAPIPTPVAGKTEADNETPDPVMARVAVQMSRAWRLLHAAQRLLETDEDVRDEGAALLLLDDAAALVYDSAETLGAEQLPS